MLSQSATPLYAQSDAVLFPKVNNFLRNEHFPIKLPLINRTGGIQLGDGERTVISKPDEFVGNFFNLPNLISLGRLVSGPFLGWMIVNEMYLPAFIGLGISGASDWLDGFVARRMGINSLIGSYIDPLADKVLIGCVAVAMVDKGLLHPGLVALVVLRDVALVGGAFYKRASSLDWNWKSLHEFFNIDGMRPEKVEPLFLSKINTVFQLVLVAAALLQPDFGTPETQPYITYLSWLVASTTVATTAGYGVQYMRSRPMAIGGKL